jgi:RNA polymerase sigma-70 factor, ECF subfamily
MLYLSAIPDHRMLLSFGGLACRNSAEDNIASDHVSQRGRAMSANSSFADLMDRLNAGDEDAARRIFNAYGQRLIALARSRLDNHILQKEGAEDIVNSALASFFRRHATQPFDLASWDNLWAVLTVITLRKCGHRTEYYRALCRDVRREMSPAVGNGDSSGSFLAIAREPSPEEVVALNDVLGELLRGLDERERQIVLLTLEMHSVAEISSMVRRSEYLVRKLLAQVRQRWERLCE